MSVTELNIDEGADKVGEIIWDAVMNGATIKDLKGVPDQTMDSIYAYAYGFYKQGRLDDAAVFFRFLCIYDFYNPEYIMGMAAVHQLKKEFHQAADLYAVAFALAKSDYRPMFYSGQCQLAMRRMGKARQCFEIVVKDCDDQALQQKAQAYLDVIRQGAAPAAETSHEKEKTHD
jgi:type III secretion system low calcium response chaperone LcrH/SycD